MANSAAETSTPIMPFKETGVGFRSGAVSQAGATTDFNDRAEDEEEIIVVEEEEEEEVSTGRPDKPAPT